jgi:hypothetical protein
MPPSPTSTPDRPHFISEGEVAMNWWVYRCNKNSNPYNNAWGDWLQFFAGDLPPNGRWGLTSVCRVLAALRPGDMVLAYQTDRDELVGLAKMMRFEGQEVHLEPVTKFGRGLRIRRLKNQYPDIAEIRAFQEPGTLYSIAEYHAKNLIEIALREEGKVARWTVKEVLEVYDQAGMPIAAFDLRQSSLANEFVMKCTREKHESHYVRRGEHLHLSKE